MKNIMFCGALLASTSLHAQDSVEFKTQLEKKLVESKALVGTIFGQMVSGRTVKGSPYSAQAVSESVQTLADGNRISRSNTSSLYRDMEGRERREESMGDSKTVFLSDPVEGVQYTLETQSKIARKTTRLSLLKTDGHAIAPPRPPSAPGTTYTSAYTTTDHIMINGAGGGRGGEISTFSIRTDGVKAENAKVEHLGTQIMEGVSAEGTRTTTTIPAGEIGNDQPLIITDERWFSPDLQVAVMTKHSDPRTGTTTYKLTNINRSEPSRQLFEVPSDYTVRGNGDTMKVITRPEELQ